MVQKIAEGLQDCFDAPMGASRNDSARRISTHDPF
jgi:hypothetical protein